MNQSHPPLADVQRAARDLVRDRPCGDRQVGAPRLRPSGELVHAAAGAVLRSEVARDPVRHGQGEGRAREVQVQGRLQGHAARRRGSADRERDRPDPPAVAEAAQHRRHIRHRRTRRPRSTTSASATTSSAFSYWTMDIADPDELVTFAVDPAGGAESFYTGWKNPQVIKLSHQAQREQNARKRAAPVRADPADCGQRRLPRLPLLLAVPLRVLEQAARLRGLPARELPSRGRVARVAV